MKYENIITMFQIKERKDNKCRCICPAHNDKEGSLTISKGNRGTVFHCQAGCRTEDILQKVGLQLSDLHDNKEKSSPSASKTNQMNALAALTPMADVAKKEAEWLISGYIPKSQVTIMAGDGGTGKTFVWASIAAAISTGRKAFFEEVPEEFAGRDPQTVLFFSSEDSLEYTLKKRLDDAGADEEAQKRILTIGLDNPNFKNIKFDSGILEKYISIYRPALVIFDPLQAFIPPTLQMSQRNAMRQAISPLIGLGEKYQTTFLIICHTNKRTGCYGRNRIADSADIWDLARSVLICGKTSESGIYYLSQEKSNYSEPAPTALFSISDGAAKFKSYTDKKDSDFVSENNDSHFRPAPMRAEAEEFIRNFLANDSIPTRELDSAAKAAGISDATLARAKTNLKQSGVLGSKSQGFGKNKIYLSFIKGQELKNDCDTKTDFKQYELKDMKSTEPQSNLKLMK